MFQDFYTDFDRARAEDMLSSLGIDPANRFGTLSKGTKEKVQLLLVMSRRARLYLLDEPIGGVDPAARDYILNTIVTNFDPDATVIISTHLIADVEPVLDGFIFLHEGKVLRTGYTENVRQESGKTLDELFREVFKCLPNC
jgi:ABC-2 type transport system ATP-binding protein